jgi:hypothetical protein
MRAGQVGHSGQNIPNIALKIAAMRPQKGAAVYRSSVVSPVDSCIADFDITRLHPGLRRRLTKCRVTNGVIVSLWSRAVFRGDRLIEPISGEHRQIEEGKSKWFLRLLRD